MNMFKEKFGVKKRDKIKFYPFMRNTFILSCILFTHFNNPIYANSEFKTREEADKFLNAYCIDILNFTKGVVKRQEELAKQEKWREFFEHGGMIQGASQIYANFCKK